MENLPNIEFKSNAYHPSNGINLAVAELSTPPPPKDFNLTGIWTASLILVAFVIFVVIYGLVKTYLGETNEPEHQVEVPAARAAVDRSRDAQTNTIITVSADVPEVYVQTIDLDEEK